MLTLMVRGDMSRNGRFGEMANIQMRWKKGHITSADSDEYGEFGENGEVGNNTESGKTSPIP